MPTCTPVKTKTTNRPASKQEKKAPRQLKDLGLTPEEIEEIRISVAPLARFWNAPGMEDYDDL